MNGQFCVVVGFDRDTIARLHCRLEGENQQIVKIKRSSLIEEEACTVFDNYMRHSGPISDDKIVEGIEAALEQHRNITEEGRPDMIYRLNLYRDLLQKIQSPDAVLNDSDYRFPCGAGSHVLEADSNFGIVMTAAKPACYGDGMIDMRHVDIGLKGDDQTDCTICHEVLASDSNEILVTLPCLHVFHRHCIVSWLRSNVGDQNWNCPTCREVVPDIISTYINDHDEQTQKRVNEYPVSGFCTHCQIYIMERNRNTELPIYE